MKYIKDYIRWNDFGDIIISPVLMWFLFFKALPMMMPCVQRFTNSTPGNLEGDRSREAILHAMRCQCRCHMSFQVTWMARHLPQNPGKTKPVTGDDFFLI